MSRERERERHLLDFLDESTSHLEGLGLGVEALTVQYRNKYLDDLYGNTGVSPKNVHVWHIRQ